MQKCLPFKKEIGGEFKQDFYFILFYLIVTKGGERDLNLVLIIRETRQYHLTIKLSVNRLSFMIVDKPFFFFFLLLLLCFEEDHVN